MTKTNVESCVDVFWKINKRESSEGVEKNAKGNGIFSIKSEICILNFFNPRILFNLTSLQVQNIYGAKISNLEANKKIVVTLVWPSLVLYNRVGNCTIKATSFRSTGAGDDDIQTMSFNTTINQQALSDYLLCSSVIDFC